MRPSMIRPLAAVLALMAVDLPGRAQTLELVSATYWGTAGDDDIQGAAAGPDGTILIAGNTARAMDALPGGVKPVTLGEAAKNPACGCGFVAQLSGDGQKLLRYVQFAPGVVILTSVQSTARGIYVSGYASEALEPVLAGRPGLIRTYPLASLNAPALPVPGTAPAPAAKKDALADRPGLGRRGAPFVVRLSTDLDSLECGTYLEGWQQVWDKHRVKQTKPKWEMLPREFFWQPTSLAPLAAGDLLVSHDGGYNRPNTPEDEKRVAGAKDPKKLLSRLTFYDVCDWVSRLSPDLDKRTWRKAIYTPESDPAVAAGVRDSWPLPHYSNPRTHRMRLDKQENLYLCGWSASATSKEPWWAPYLWKMNPADGAVIWKAYEYDPLSGGGNRLNGNVADTAATALAIDSDGNVVCSLLSDGGNTVMESSPQAVLGKKFEGPAKGPWYGGGLVHWWGQIHRLDGKTREGLGRVRLGRTAWVTDLASLPKNDVLAIGRCNGKMEWTADAWQPADPEENPEGFLRLYSAGFDLRFSTPLHGIVPFEIAAVSDHRCIIVGRSDLKTALTKNALVDKPQGAADGYLMVVDWKDAGK